VHAVLYRRNFEAPVEYRGVRLHSARRYFTEADALERYTALAEACGATLLDEPGCYYTLGVQVMDSAAEAAAARAGDAAAAGVAAHAHARAADASAVAAPVDARRQRAERQGSRIASRSQQEPLAAPTRVLRRSTKRRRLQPA